MSVSISLQRLAPLFRMVISLLRSFQLGAFLESGEFLLESGDLIVGEVFEIDEGVPSAGGAADEFVEFEVDGFGVPVLGVLNQKDHQEGNDGGGGIDD